MGHADALLGGRPRAPCTRADALPVTQARCGGPGAACAVPRTPKPLSKLTDGQTALPGPHWLVAPAQARRTRTPPLAPNRWGGAGAHGCGRRISWRAGPKSWSAHGSVLLARPMARRPEGQVAPAVRAGDQRRRTWWSGQELGWCVLLRVLGNEVEGCWNDQARDFLPLTRLRGCRAPVRPRCCAASGWARWGGVAVQVAVAETALGPTAAGLQPAGFRAVTAFRCCGLRPARPSWRRKKGVWKKQFKYIQQRDAGVHSPPRAGPQPHAGPLGGGLPLQRSQPCGPTRSPCWSCRSVRETPVMAQRSAWDAWGTC